MTCRQVSASKECPGCVLFHRDGGWVSLWTCGAWKSTIHVGKPGTQMTPVLIRKGLVLGCWPSKIEVIRVLGINYYKSWSDPGIGAARNLHNHCWNVKICFIIQLKQSFINGWPWGSTYGFVQLPLATLAKLPGGKVSKAGSQWRLERCAGWVGGGFLKGLKNGELVLLLMVQKSS